MFTKHDQHVFIPQSTYKAKLALYYDFWRTRPQNQLAPKTNSPSKELQAFV